MAGASPVHAPPAAPDTQQVVLEEIVVTAQRRSESLQTVPIAVDALRADLLQTMGIRESKDLVNAAADLSMTKSLASPGVYLRVSAQGSLAWGRPRRSRFTLMTCIALRSRAAI